MNECLWSVWLTKIGFSQDFSILEIFKSMWSEPKIDQLKWTYFMVKLFFLMEVDCWTKGSHYMDLQGMHIIQKS